MTYIGTFLYLCIKQVGDKPTYLIPPGSVDAKRKDDMTQITAAAELINQASNFWGSVFEENGRFYVRRDRDDEAGGGWRRELLANSEEELANLVAEQSRINAIEWHYCVIKTSCLGSVSFSAGKASYETGEVFRSRSGYESAFFFGTEEEVKIALSLLADKANQRLTPNELGQLVDAITAQQVAEKENEDQTLFMDDWGYFYCKKSSIGGNQRFEKSVSVEEAVSSFDKDDLVRAANYGVEVLIRDDKSLSEALRQNLEAQVSKKLFGK